MRSREREKKEGERGMVTGRGGEIRVGGTGGRGGGGSVCGCGGGRRMWGGGALCGVGEREHRGGREGIRTPL